MLVQCTTDMSSFTYQNVFGDRYITVKVNYTQQKKKVNTFSSSDFSYKTFRNIHELYIKLKKIKLSFKLIFDHKVKSYASVNTFIYLSQGAKVKLAKLHKTEKKSQTIEIRSYSYCKEK